MTNASGTHLPEIWSAFDEGKQLLILTTCSIPASVTAVVETGLREAVQRQEIVVFSRELTWKVITFQDSVLLEHISTPVGDNVDRIVLIHDLATTLSCLYDGIEQPGDVAHACHACRACLASRSIPR